MNKLDEIKEKIRTTNPEITEEILNLLYEYIIQRLNNEFNTLNLLDSGK